MTQFHTMWDVLTPGVGGGGGGGGGGSGSVVVAVWLGCWMVVMG